MSPDTTVPHDQPKKPYRTPKLSRLDAPPADDHTMIVLDLVLLLLDLRDLTRQLEAAVVKLSKHDRLAPPRIAPVFKDRTRLSDAERDALQQRAQRPLDDDQYWDSLLSQRG